VAREIFTAAGGAANDRGVPASYWGAPLCVGVWSPVRDVDIRLNVDDPRVVADVGLDVDRRGHNARRSKPRGGLGGGSQAWYADTGRSPCRSGLEDRAESRWGGRQSVV
jgi:hypothetical protein